MNILICDDEKECTLSVKKLLDLYSSKNKIKFNYYLYNNPNEIQFDTIKFDIAILDIEMNNINGLNIAKKLKLDNRNIIIIILTSFHSYLDDAMRLKVFRYLSKPIEKSRFFLCLEEAIKEYYNLNKTIIVKLNDNITRIRTDDIVFIEKSKHGSIIHTTYSNFEVKYRLSELYQSINQPDIFCYSHSSILVNLKYIISFNKTEVILRINKNETISTYVSQRKYADLKSNFYNYIGGIK